MTDAYILQRLAKLEARADKLELHLELHRANLRPHQWVGDEKMAWEVAVAINELHASLPPDDDNKDKIAWHLAQKRDEYRRQRGSNTQEYQQALRDEIAYLRSEAGKGRLNTALSDLAQSVHKRGGFRDGQIK